MAETGLDNNEKALKILDLLTYVYTEVCEEEIASCYGDKFCGCYHSTDFDWFDEFYYKIKDEVDINALQDLSKEVLDLAGLPKESISQETICNIANMTTSEVVEVWKFLCNGEEDDLIDNFIMILCDHYKGKKTVISPKMFLWFQKYINNCE